jgi:hypothetical protein
MKAVLIDKFVQVRPISPVVIGDADCSQVYDQLAVADVADPVRKEDELLINIEAAGVNFVDLLYVSTVLNILIVIKDIKVWPVILYQFSRFNFNFVTEISNEQT